MPPIAYITEAELQSADLGVVAAAFVVYFVLASIWPAIIVKPTWWIVTHTLYRLRIFQKQNVPRSGPALLVCNPVSYVDWMLIRAACPRRVRFVTWVDNKKNFWLRLFLRVTNSIPIDASGGPRLIAAAQRTIGDALDRGEVVCIFAESRTTSDGTLLPFQQNFERVLKLSTISVPVIPLCISQIWGSIFSYRGGRIIWKWPTQIPYPVAVMFGEALPATVTSAEVRQQIQELSAETAILDSGRSRPVHRHFARNAVRYRQMFRPCLIDTTSPKPRTLSYAKSLVGSILIARWLKTQLGTEKHVGTWLPSSVGGALANIALAFLGRTTVNLNYTAGIDATRSAVTQTGLKAVVTSQRFLGRMPLDLGDDVKLIHLEDAAGAIGKWQRIRTFLTVLLLPGWMIDRWVLGMGRHSLDDIATIIFSSGSTGEPKGVMLSHRNIASNAESIVAHVDVDHHDRVLGVLPFFHSFGYTVALWMPLVISGSVVYHPDPRQAKEIGDICKTHQCTVLLSTGTFLRFYLRRCEPDDFRTLRILICGAEKLPTSLTKEFEAKFGVLPTEGYGCTELSPVVSANIADQEIAGTRQVGNKLGTIGQPIPGVAVRTYDPDTMTMTPLPLGQEGLLFVKGPNVMVGYLGKPQQTARVVLDGWYNTGDMARVDEDGFISITGRLSRFAKIGGEMVPLEKVEEDMHTILETTDRVLAVSAVPDERKGERLVVLHLATMTLTVDALTTKLCTTGMPNLWIPSDRDFHLVVELPLRGTGKLDLRKVKEMALTVGKEKGSG